MGHGHGHGHAPADIDPADRTRYVNRLAIAFSITLSYFVVEAIFALLTGSLTLLADAGHMLTDTVGLGLALAAILVAARAGRSPQRTFGLHRLEVLAALANAALLLAVALYVLWHAVVRFSDPVHLPTHQLFLVAVIGLLANFTCFLLLRDGAKDNLNVRAAYLEVVADALGSVAVLLAAVLIVTTGAGWVDPAFALALAAFIVPRTLRLAGHALRMLLQMAPRGVDCARVQADLHAVPGVRAVRDLHVWTLSSGMDVATAHLQVEPGAEDEALRHAESVLHERYNLAHTTLQIEVAPRDAVHARWCAAREASVREPSARELSARSSPMRGRHRRLP